MAISPARWRISAVRLISCKKWPKPTRQIPRLSAQLSFAHKRVGALLLHENRFAEALKEYQASLAIDERLTAAHPNDAIAEYNKTFAYGDMGVIYGCKAISPRRLSISAKP